jgi:adenine-specific DNA-methyltransferase
MLKIEGIPSSGLVSFLESGAIMSNNDERISHQSLDLGEFNKERLLEMFPIFRTEGGGVDFDRLKLALGESVEVGKEVFGMRWPGKADSIRLANAPSHGTLSPDEKESVNFDTTQNLIIEGDNLEVLKLLQKSYQGKVKMIYIDPPYNTGNDFVYEDDFADGIKNYLQQTGQIDGEGNRLTTNSETDGRFHSNWLNMIFPRLNLALNLLADDGVIFVSIDDNELSNLIKAMNEIFGDSNHLGTVTRVAKKTSNKGTFFAPSKDYVVCFSKNSQLVETFYDDVSDDYKAKFNARDDRGDYATVGLYQAALDPMRGCVNQRYWIKCPDGSFCIPPGEVHPQQIADAAHVPPNSFRDKVWRWSYSTYKEKQDLLVFKKTSSSPLLNEKGNRSDWNVYTKYYLADRLEDGVRPRDFIDNLTNDLGTKSLKDLGLSDFFDFAKPVELISKLMTWLALDGESIVMDFFAGSGTTAHAVMAQNAKDGGNRKFILVQLPEQVDPESEAAKAGFDNIADITKERVRRAGKKIIEESDGKLKLKGEGALDFGFRVLKLNESNIEDWNSEEASKSPKDLLDALKTTRLKSGRSEQDVVFEVLVKYGIELTSTVEVQKIGKGSIWKIAGGELIVVVSPGLTNADLNAIVKMSPKVVVMIDEAFVPEALKTNARAIFKDAKIELKTF